jgi:beta-lactamase regulating signal transducer with metallopeptidase domain
MERLFLINLIPAKLITAILIFLLHSLWLGFLCAQIAILIRIFVKSTQPVLRYNLLLALLAVFTVISGWSLLVQLPNETSSLLQMREEALIQGESVTDKSFLYIISHMKEYLAEKAVVFSQHKYAELIVYGWMALLFLRFSQLCWNMRLIANMKRPGSFTVPAQWTDRLPGLVAMMNIGRNVQLFISDKIASPVTIGTFKPVILAPLSMFTQLSPEQTEAVLIHELEHIRRNDYLVNILQKIVEIIFFFNPAILWISAQIRNEREKCVDDAVLSATRSKSAYVHALVYFSTHTQSAYRLMPGFAGFGNMMLHRVKRILNNGKEEISKGERYLLCGITLFLCSFLFIAANNNEGMSASDLHLKHLRLSADTVPGQLLISVTDHQEQHYKIMVEKNTSSITAWYVNGRQGADDRSLQKAVLQQVLGQLEADNAAMTEDAERLNRDALEIARSSADLEASASTLNKRGKVPRKIKEQVKNNQLNLQTNEAVIAGNNSVMKENINTIKAALANLF